VFKVFTKKNSEYTSIERGFISLFAFFIFGCIGMVVRLIIGPQFSLGSNGLLIQYGPFFFGSGLLFAALGYYFPKPVSILMLFIPVPGSSS